MNNRRWYDKELGCSRIVDQIEAMQQPLVREFATKCMQHIADQIRTVLQTRKGDIAIPVSLGLAAVQGLYVGKREQRRWYDVEPMLPKAIASLYSLPMEGLTTLSFKMADTYNLIALYDYACTNGGQRPSVDDLFNITKFSLEGNKDEAEILLISIFGLEQYETYNAEYSD